MKFSLLCDFHSSNAQCHGHKDTVIVVKMISALDKFILQMETIHRGKKDLNGSLASLLFKLKELISSRVGSVIILNVKGSIFRKSPPYIRGDFAIAHRVICEKH